MQFVWSFLFLIRLSVRVFLSLQVKEMYREQFELDFAISSRYNFAKSEITRTDISVVNSSAVENKLEVKM